MNTFKLCLIFFCLLVLIFYFYNLFKASQMLKNKKNRKNKDKYIFSVKYLMNKFKNMYNLPDHRNDPLYGSWQHSYDSFISAPINPTVQSKNFVIMKGFK